MTKTIRRNTIRMAEVWMDDYKKFFYDRFDHELVSHSYYMNKRCIVKKRVERKTALQVFQMRTNQEQSGTYMTGQGNNST
ncbi:hypothetical protein EB796_012162 [Bugula neritina]|uniref:Uncharacterized protein n=1 Tax=Bugula neritina TaxID=10212 RepID=A0A7J7JU78_BUGNE|nr:hypothetical protein EB796_012162 [Bugula neritina]